LNQWVVLSGKGGTGKTSLVASFARLAGNAVLADADVDAANLAIALGAKRINDKDFYSGETAVIDSDTCTACGACLEVCRYDAIEEHDPAFSIDGLACEGCNACVLVCPTQAITLRENRAGQIMESETEFGMLVHAELGVAEDNSGKLVAEVIETAKKKADDIDAEVLLVDGPPGIGCPVHASVTGADRMLAVAEPSSSGLHDLDRLLDLADHFKVKVYVAINRYDTAPDVTDMIEKHCLEKGKEVIGRIPFDPDIPKGLCKGKVPFDAAQDSTKKAIKDLWQAWKNR